MRPWSERFIELAPGPQTTIVVTMAITVGILIFLLFGPTRSPKERCDEAQIKVEIYEECLLATDCYMRGRNRDRLIAARMQEIKWCDHPLSRGE